MTRAIERNSQVDTSATRLFVLDDLHWSKPKRSPKTLEQVNRQMPLSREETLRRAEANTVKLTGRKRF
jgi:hypothetical protein